MPYFDYSDKLKLAEMLCPGESTEVALPKVEDWLAAHENCGDSHVMDCECQDCHRTKTMTVRDALDRDPERCPCMDENRFKMKCGRCDHIFIVPESLIEDSDCPKCGQYAPRKVPQRKNE